MIRSLMCAESLRGTVRLPGDKSISHRYAMLAAIADGTSRLRRFAASQDCRSTLECLHALGVPVREELADVVVEGRGLHGLRPASGALNAGNSGTTMRLLSGILAGQPFESTLAGDESLARRPMARIAQPLRLMGASVETAAGDTPPLRIRGGRLKAIRYKLPVASAQVKSCVLLAGLFGDAPTGVEEAAPTRDHTEIALRHFGVEVRTKGAWIEVEPPARLEARDVEVPGDLSGAAFFLVAAAIVPGSDLFVPEVGLNRRRRELLVYLQSAGVDVSVENESEIAGESRGDLRVRYCSSALEGPMPPIGGDRVAGLIDEIPVLAILGAHVDGGLEVSGARELRVKESDRISALVSNLRAMGADIEEKPDGLILRGGRRLRGAEIETHGDHRIAMAFGVAGLAADGATRIRQADCADVSFPGFWEMLGSVIRL